MRAAAAVAVANGFPDAITFDMGGTSTDVCLVLDGAPAPAAERSVGGYTVRFPALDIHTIGAGGGSIAQLDPGGALLVGPRSAGADPGPGLLRPRRHRAHRHRRRPGGRPHPGRRRVRWARARPMRRPSRRWRGAGVTADGVIRVVDASMERALRAVSVERGVDPRSLALVAFGGAGPLHACALADALDMAAVIVPARAGRAVRGRPADLAAPARPRALVAHAARPHRAGRRSTPAGGRGGEAGRPRRRTTTTAVDCRYAGQSHELTVASAAAFHEAHQQRNGFSRPDAPVEVVAIRATASLPSGFELTDLPAPSRSPATRPAADRRVRLHHLAPRRLDRRARRRRRPRAAEAVVSLDAAGLQVLMSRLGGIADEMGAVLRRSASSPNIKERADCSAAVFDASGDLLAQAEHIPVHLGLDAGLGAGGHRRLRRLARARRPRRASTTRSRAAPTSTTSRSSPRCSTTSAD